MNGYASGTSTFEVGVYGSAQGTGTSLSNKNMGTYGFANGHSNENVGATGHSNGTGTYNTGVEAQAYGFGTYNYGIYAYANNATTNNIALFASTPTASGWAGYFNGDVYVTGDIDVLGTVYAASKSFKIDHPIDPENKDLVYTSIESNEMLNVSSGNVVTDSQGFATVQMPDYFEAANKDFRYQLTVIGTFEQAIVKEKIADNKFVIQTSAPNVEVSWQVTSVRNDKWANANRVEAVQQKENPGEYIHPEVYGQERTEPAIEAAAEQSRKQTEERASANQEQAAENEAQVQKDAESAEKEKELEAKRKADEQARLDAREKSKSALENVSKAQTRK